LHIETTPFTTTSVTTEASAQTPVLIIAATHRGDHPRANHIDDLGSVAAGTDAVLISDEPSLRPAIEKLQTLGINRIVPVDRASPDLHGVVDAALASLRARSGTGGPSRSVLRAARACATPWDVGVLGDLAPVAASLARMAGGPVEFIAATMLSLAGGTVTGRFDIQVRPGFKVPPISWFVLVGDPSSQKSPSMDLVVEPLRRVEARLRASAKLAAKAAAQAHEAAGKKGKPERVIEPRAMITDATVEAAQHLAADQSRGLFAHYDEMSIWFSSIYRKSGLGDVGLWLRAYSGAPMDIDRRGLPEPLHVPCWGLSVAAAVPPQVLDQMAALGSLNVDDGFDARICYIYPTSPPLTIRPEKNDQDAVDRWAKIVERVMMWRMQSASCDVIEFESDAREAFESWRLEMLTEARRGGRDVSSWDGKKPGLVARLAGTLSVLDAALVGDRAPRVVTLDQLRRAGRLADLLSAHRRRVELARGAPSIERIASELAGWILEHRAPVLDTFEIRGLVPGLRGKSVAMSLRELDDAGWLSTPIPRRNDEPIPRVVVVDPAVFGTFAGSVV